MILVLITVAVAALMVIPVMQYANGNHARPATVYSYGNDIVSFSGQNSAIGLGPHVYPISWSVFRVNSLQYYPAANGNSYNPLKSEKFTHYRYSRIENAVQNSAIMVRWNSNVRVAEIFSFLGNGIDASIAIENLNTSGQFIGTFSMGMKHHDFATVSGFSPYGAHSSRGESASFIIPSHDYTVYAGNVSVSWQNEASIFYAGMLTETPGSGSIALPFGPFTLNTNETYSIDPIIMPSMIIRDPNPGPVPIPPPSPKAATFSETGLPSGTTWSVTLAGQTQTSTSNSITFDKLPGSYSYTIGSEQYYRVSPSGGSVSVTEWSGSSVAITFTPYGSPQLSGLSIVNSSGMAYGSAVPGDSTLTFSVNYRNATGNAPGPGYLGWFFRSGVWFFADTPNGGVIPLKFLTPTGNGTASFTWTAQPGYYTGFTASMTNEKSSTQVSLNNKAMIYTMFPEINGTTGLYINFLDAENGGAAYDSYGSLVFIGSQAVTFNSETAKSTTIASLSWGMWNKTRTLATWNFTQSFSWIGDSAGQQPSSSDAVLITPKDYLFQSYNGQSNVTATEKAIWNGIALGLAIASFVTIECPPVSAGLGIASAIMAFVGPYIFSPLSSPTKTFSNTDARFNNYSYSRTGSFSRFNTRGGSTYDWSFLSSASGNELYLGKLFLEFGYMLPMSSNVLNYFIDSVTLTEYQVAHQNDTSYSYINYFGSPPNNPPNSYAISISEPLYQLQEA